MSIFTCNVPQTRCDLIVTQVNIVAPASATTILDELAIADYDAIQWNVLVEDPSENKRKFQGVFATHEGGVTPFHNIFSRVGTKFPQLDYELDVDINLGSFRLKITNNSSQDYLVQVTKFPVENFTP